MASTKTQLFLTDCTVALTALYTQPTESSFLAQKEVSEFEFVLQVQGAVKEASSLLTRWRQCKQVDSLKVKLRAIGEMNTKQEI